jgi:succinyl-diaminopimelate desuccinylase
MSPTLELACELLRRPSVTPDDQDCQTLLAARLARLGFEIEHLPSRGVDNLWAHRGRGMPVFTFAGHTDVVPPGPLDQWTSDPFTPEIRDGLLYARGAADMKGSIAAMITACERFIADHPYHEGTLGFVITSDEEGPATDGTVKVVEHLVTRGERIDYCLVGEPSSQRELGDTVKNGRRGSLGGVLRIFGQQGHVAYPQCADNPIHRAAPALAELVAMEWDAGNAWFPPTSFQISNIRAGTGVENVIPGELEVWFNLRFSTESSVESLQSRINALLDRHGLNFAIDWKLSGGPFLTPPGELVAAATAAIREICGRSPELSTSGGTSDGRFIATLGGQVLELGPVNATIHKANEYVSVCDLDSLSLIYEKIIKSLLIYRNFQK